MMIELTAATFPSADRFNYINCTSEPSPVKAVPVRIEIQPDMVSGDVIELQTRGFSDSDGTQPVPGTQTSFVHVLGSIDARKFVELIIGPYATAIKPIKSGSLDAKYSVKRKGDLIGTSKRALVKLDLKMPGGGTCPEGQ
jgi:hypothetical protein